MSQHDALGRAGAAAGIKQLGDGVFIEAENVGALGMAFVQELFVGQIRDRDFVVQGYAAPELGAERLQMFDQRCEVVFKQQHPRAGVVQNIGQLEGRQAHVQGHHDGARLDDTVISLQKLVIIEAKIRDAIAGLDSLLGERGGEALAALSELGIGILARAAHHADLFSE